jgi:hypothetical protein
MFEQEGFASDSVINLRVVLRDKHAQIFRLAD